MKKSKLRKIALLSALSTMLLSGCGQNNIQNNEVTYEIQTTEATTEESDTIYNQTIAKIYVDYKEKSKKDIQIDDLLIESFEDPKYIWNKNGENYIYDYRLNYDNNQEYEYCDPGYNSKMYAVIVRNDDGTYEPIAALADIDNRIVNVEVTYLYDQTTYEPSKNYIYLSNPTKEDLYNIKNGDEFINNSGKELTLSNKNN